jgi:hypothetical protein
MTQQQGTAVKYTLITVKAGVKKVVICPTRNIGQQKTYHQFYGIASA